MRSSSFALSSGCQVRQFGFNGSVKVVVIDNTQFVFLDEHPQVFAQQLQRPQLVPALHLLRVADKFAILSPPVKLLRGFDPGDYRRVRIIPLAGGLERTIGAIEFPRTLVGNQGQFSQNVVSSDCRSS